ncbi:MAG: MerR family transcriptional regulator [Cellulomonadaceae bacterium]
MSASEIGAHGPAEGVPEPVELAAARARPGVAVAVVARRLGVAPATLRTWDRRYGLGPSERSAGSHRRYSRDDVLRLLVMRRLTLEGVAPADAARAALEADLDAERTRRADDVSAQQAARRSEHDLAPEHATLVHFARPGDSPGELPNPADVVDAALRHDTQACQNLLYLPPGADVVEWWTRLVDPAFTRLAERTVLAKPGEAPVLMLTSAAMRAVRKHQEAREGTGGTHPSRLGKIVLVFTPPGEPYALHAHVLAAALSTRDVVARIVMGPASSRRAMELVGMVRPIAVVLATGLAQPDLALVGSLHEGLPELPIVVAVEDDAAAGELPLAPAVQRVRSFTSLYHEVLSIASAAG